jgi:hypothetical protein
MIIYNFHTKSNGYLATKTPVLNVDIYDFRYSKPINISLND